MRLVPPLIISEEEFAEGVRRLDDACADLEASPAPVKKGAYA